MSKLTVGPWIAAQKLPSRDAARDRLAFLERTRVRRETPSVAGFPLVGLGGSCGKPCFALPYVLTWTEENTRRLEELAAEFGCYVEYGAYPHLKLHENDQEVGAVQDWTTFGTVYLRPGYERAEELLVRLAGLLQPDKPRQNHL
ncbi:hypothetical protein DAERI_020271 [Deinococcus aerius]|uniref:Uncharacterized protein n=2 Tax=Deinococcus TaxID=1298 RepID=A0A2I9CSN2_9DEIO|nr:MULTISPECIES: hypothetical protein [Deinococcus]MBB5293867.1 hypothetical protein [Deinococcus metallilatus]QBY07187.1 hypothetical protein E5F05_04180 [Deinococcus metallilatus]RXJ14659.1 hypothetical protein ERJ73_02910 [Deinococcus metallilatus]TLK30779.1 hypothetical protein FCS05_03225 [Deinococcus metallilatus]GBF04674.1 hypothetical protein DAERI_020271 [Deinococcus aerius]